jgi:hypothetical protein
MAFSFLKANKCYAAMKNQNEKSKAGEAAQEDGEKITQKSQSRGKTPKEIVDEHIKNKHDVITDEEFRNAELNLGVDSDVAHEPLDIPDKPDRPKDESKDKGKITPWDVIE